MVTVLKLGGSVITEKDRAETLDGDALDRAADAVAAVAAGAAGNDPADLVLVHGGGSFGHHHASEHDVSTDRGTHDGAAVLGIHRAMTTLNRFVLERLRERGVPVVPVHPLSVAERDVEGELTLPVASIERLRTEGFVPVLHGDVVGTADAGVTVLSGDELVVELARELAADRVGVCSTVPGVLDEDDAPIDRIEAFDAVQDVLGGSSATDVSGGMAGKVRALLALDVPASIFDLDSLAGFLEGDRPGTTVDGQG